MFITAVLYQLSFSALVAILSFGVLSAQAQSLVTGQGVSVEAKDIQEDLERAPPEVRAELAKKGALKNNIANVYVRRVLAAEADKSGVAKAPLVLSAIEKAKERILSDAMLESIDQKNQPSLDAIEAYARTMYSANQQKFGTPEQVRASHILIRTGDQDAKSKIQDIRKQIQGGSDFEELAKTRSQDPGSAVKGGDLGYFGRGRMIDQFEKVVFAMSKPGEVSDVFESPFGFHIIKLIDKKPAGVKPFPEVKDQLMKEAQNEILMQGRLKEQDRILKDAKFDDQALESLEKSLTVKP
jgi:peptidyl-prolyl cis-trans isomerase C